MPEQNLKLEQYYRTSNPNRSTVPKKDYRAAVQVRITILQHGKEGPAEKEDLGTETRAYSIGAISS
jgi:hypothetical protein